MNEFHQNPSTVAYLKFYITTLVKQKVLFHFFVLVCPNVLKVAYAISLTFSLW